MPSDHVAPQCRRRILWWTWTHHMWSPGVTPPLAISARTEGRAGRDIASEARYLTALSLYDRPRPYRGDHLLMGARCVRCRVLGLVPAPGEPRGYTAWPHAWQGGGMALLVASDAEAMVAVRQYVNGASSRRGAP